VRIHGYALVVLGFHMRGVNLNVRESGIHVSGRAAGDRESLPIALREYGSRGGNQYLRRIWYCTYHPEAFQRYRSFAHVDIPRYYMMALRERLSDMAYYVAYGLRSPRPAFMSTMAYFTDKYSGTVLHSRVLGTNHMLDEEALAQLLRIPDYRLMSRLKVYMQSTSSTNLKANSNEILATATKTVMSSTLSPDFWSSLHVQAQYGPTAAVYHLMYKNTYTTNLTARQERDCTARTDLSPAALLKEKERKEKVRLTSAARRQKRKETITDEEREAENTKLRAKMQAKRAVMTEKEKIERRAKEKVMRAAFRATETPKQKEEHLKARRVRQNALARKKRLGIA
jgi:hypothetical protein